MFDGVGFGTAAAARLPRRGDRQAAAVQDLAADRAGDHGLRPRHLGDLLQLARAYTIFARDGELVPLSLVRVDTPPAGKPVISPQTAATVRHMLELAVQPGGTAPRARIMGYRVAGKTGTAHKQETAATRRQVRSLVRRLRAGVATRAS